MLCRVSILLHEGFEMYFLLIEHNNEERLIYRLLRPVPTAIRICRSQVIITKRFREFTIAERWGESIYIYI